MFYLLILIKYLIMTWKDRFEFGFLRVLHWKAVMQGDLVLSWNLSLHSSPLLFLLLAPLYTDRGSYTCAWNPS